MFKKLRHILAPISTLILFSVANFTHAEGLGIIESFSINGIAGLGSWVLFMAGTIFSNLVTFGGTLVNWSLNLNSSVLTSQTVQVGWIISRDLANLGFVLTILIIAFATILRVGGYQTKQLLFKLIAAAILVNFSLVFAGIFLDFSGMLTNYFLAQTTSGDTSALGGKLANSFGIQKLLLVKTDASFISKNISSINSDPNSALLFFASLFFVVAFTSICAITLLGLAVMFLIRYIWLTMLLILMPVACLLWIWPETQGQWSKWWSEFLKWVWFGPAATFWIYIALSIATNGDAYNLAGTEQFQMAGILENMTATQNFGAIIGQMIAVIGILIGGMMTAEKMGGYGAKISTDLASGLKNKVLGGVGMVGGGIGGGIGRLAARGGVAVFGDNKFIEKMQKYGATSNPFWKAINAPTRALGNLASDIPRIHERIIDQYGKELKEKDYSAEELGTRIHGAITDEEKMAYLKLLDEKGAITGDHLQYTYIADKYGQKLKNTMVDNNVVALAASGNTEELARKIGEKISDILPQNIAKIPWAKLLTKDAEKSPLRGSQISGANWKAIQDAIVSQIAAGKIRGERVGGIYGQLSGEDLDNFHAKMMAALKTKMLSENKTLAEINSGLFHYYQSSAAKRLLGDVLPPVTAPQQETVVTASKMKTNL